MLNINRIGKYLGHLTCHMRSVKKYGFLGDYKRFEDVQKLCDGYSAPNILDITLKSTLKVKSGEAVFERDSYIFDEVQYSYPLLACLFKIAIECNNTLSLVDFGGSLGSHYFQNRNFLSPIGIKQWTVVEQPHYVETGNRVIADGILAFSPTIDDVVGADVLLSSSTLQYLEEPYKWVSKFIEKGYKYILFDRIQLNDKNKDRLTLQIVPPEIYDARYPSWFLNEEKLLSLFDGKYDKILDFESNIDKANIPSKYKGYLFKKIIK